MKMNKFKNADHILNHGDELILNVSNGSKIKIMTKIDPQQSEYYPVALVSNDDFEFVTQINNVGTYTVSLNGVYDFYIDTNKPCDIFGKIIKYENDKPQILSSFEYTAQGSGLYSGAIAGLAIAGIAVVGTE